MTLACIDTENTISVAELLPPRWCSLSGQPRNPSGLVPKFAMFGKTVGRLAAGTPNHWAKVAPY